MSTPRARIERDDHNRFKLATQSAKSDEPSPEAETGRRYLQHSISVKLPQYEQGAVMKTKVPERRFRIRRKSISEDRHEVRNASAAVVFEDQHAQQLLTTANFFRYYKCRRTGP